MKVKKVHLADLEMVYAITAMEAGGRKYCIAASEKRDGSCLMIDVENGKIHKLWDGPGGVMTLLPLEGEQAFLSIDEFYPVFDSQGASIHKTELLINADEIKVKKERLCDLPFAHRIGILKGLDGRYLVGASLCSGKDYVEDWSNPGGIYVGKYRKDYPVELSNIYMGLTKNHGMFLQEMEDGSQRMLIGASEGILTVEHSGEWETKLLPAGETSDLWTADFDGDGLLEIAVIQGFHGEHIRILKEAEEGFREIAELPIHFGHVLWSGRILGELCLIGGSRGEDKSLTLYKVTEGENPVFRAVILEEGTGATQIAVDIQETQAVVYAANHGIGSVDMYVITKE